VQGIGPVKVKIEYSSPAVKDRRGKIWGGLVPYGLKKLDFGNGNPAPWRAGANENSVFEVSHDVLVEGKPLKAGRYGLHMIAGPEEWVIVFSKNADSWGSYFYEAKDDALQVTVKPKKHEYREWLTYDFVARKYDAATVEMQWEDLAVGWTVSVPNVNELLVSALKKDLQREAGFSWQGYQAAVNFCLQQKTHLDQALIWADAAISIPGIGVKNFSTMMTKSQVLTALKREDEAQAVLKAAVELPTTGPLEIHTAGRMLLAAGKAQEALKVFRLNQQRNGNVWPVNVGMARGLAANGDKAAALEYAKKALAQAPDEVNKSGLTQMVKELSAQ
jgi:tetratricopeptide (TPR) repeat protein